MSMIKDSELSSPKTEEY